MNITKETIEQAKKDMEQYDQYLLKMKTDFYTIRKTFKEMFGYEIILFENGGFEFRGMRFS